MASSRGHRGVDMRYWALCEQNLAVPLSLIDCVTDLTARLEGGDYTVVISDDRQRPDWLRPDVNWLPYGDEQYPKFVATQGPCTKELMGDLPGRLLVRQVDLYAWRVAGLRQDALIGSPQAIGVGTRSGFS